VPPVAITQIRTAIEVILLLAHDVYNEWHADAVSQRYMYDPSRLLWLWNKFPKFLYPSRHFSL